MSSVQDTPRDHSTASLIGWMSVCLLLAGWSPTDSGLRQVWSTAGLFGLATAIGLDVGYRLRNAQGIRKARAQSAKRVEVTTQKYQIQDKNIQRIRLALGGISSAVQTQSLEEEGERPATAVPTPSLIEIEIEPLNPLGRKIGGDRARSFTGDLEKIADCFISLSHNHPIESRHVRVSCPVLDRPPLRLIVTLQWRNNTDCPTSRRYNSGGKIVQVETAPAEKLAPVGA